MFDASLDSPPSPPRNVQIILLSDIRTVMLIEQIMGIRSEAVYTRTYIERERDI